MTRVGLPLLLALACTPTHATPGDDTLRGWIEQCDPDGGQQAINACAIVENARADDRLEAVLDEIDRTYAGNGTPEATRGLRDAQSSWSAQVERDVEALYPVPEGEHPSVQWGSSWVMSFEQTRTMLVRQRIAFLCEAWLPDRVRPEPAAPSSCNGPAAAPAAH